jgi:beta-phosphoglucomutase-like phosphatase (HAD superfamily)
MMLLILKDLELLEGVRDLIIDLHQWCPVNFSIFCFKGNYCKSFNRFGLEEFFTHKVSGEDFPKSKPHPAIFEHAASLSIAPKESCIIIEDS